VIKDSKVAFAFQPRPPRFRAKPATPKTPATKLDFTGQAPLGACPRCGGKVFEGEDNYVCERSQADTRPCRFKSGKVILQQPVDREQMAKLLETGRTDRLAQFVSSKTGRSFAAFLVLDDAGKVSFEFEPRTGKTTPDTKP
jgi:DNA topoisomerase-3